MVFQFRSRPLYLVKFTEIYVFDKHYFDLTNLHSPSLHVLSVILSCPLLRAIKNAKHGQKFTLQLPLLIHCAEIMQSLRNNSYLQLRLSQDNCISLNIGNKITTLANMTRISSTDMVSHNQRLLIRC